MRKRVSMAFLFIIVLIFGSIVWGQSKEKIGIATFLEHTITGTSIICKEGFADNNENNLRPDCPFILWSRHTDVAVYQSTANVGSGYVIAGNMLNPPKEVEFFAPYGEGVPEWVYPGNDFFVAAADEDFTMAAIDNRGDSVKVIKWTGPGSGEPDWTVTFPGGYFGSHGLDAAASRDGSTIAALLGKSGHPELVMFDSSSPTPIVHKEFEDLDFPRRPICLSSNGRFAAFRAGTTIVIFDRDLRRVREQIDMSYSSTPLDISGNGDLIAYGWKSLVVRQWTGQYYRELWEFNDSYHLGTVAISADGSTIAAGWYSRDYRQAKVTVHSRSSAVPLWTYEYKPAQGMYQEMICRSAISDNGQFIIVGSWGDSENTNPEVHVFDRDAGPAPFFTLDMPGSVFSVDISPDGHYASACGKHIHANRSGSGGDLVALEVPVISKASHAGSLFKFLAALPCHLLPLFQIFFKNYCFSSSL